MIVRVQEINRVFRPEVPISHRRLLKINNQDKLFGDAVVDDTVQVVEIDQVICEGVVKAIHQYEDGSRYLDIDPTVMYL